MKILRDTVMTLLKENKLKGKSHCYKKLRNENDAHVSRWIKNCNLKKKSDEPNNCSLCYQCSKYMRVIKKWNIWLTHSHWMHEKQWRRKEENDRREGSWGSRSIVVSVATGLSVGDTIPSGWERQIIGLVGHLPRRYIIIVSCIGELV